MHRKSTAATVQAPATTLANSSDTRPTVEIKISTGKLHSAAGSTALTPHQNWDLHNFSLNISMESARAPTTRVVEGSFDLVYMGEGEYAGDADNLPVNVNGLFNVNNEAETTNIHINFRGEVLQETPAHFP
jgi:hypothetical protein